MKSGNFEMPQGKKNTERASVLASQSAEKPVSKQKDFEGTYQAPEEQIVMVNPVLTKQAEGRARKPRRSISAGGASYVPKVFEDKEPKQGAVEYAASGAFKRDLEARKTDESATEFSVRTTPDTPKEYRATLSRSVSDLEQAILKKRADITTHEKALEAPSIRLRGRAAEGEVAIEESLLQAEQELRALEQEKIRAEGIESGTPANDNFEDTTNLLYFQTKNTEKLRVRLENAPDDVNEAVQATLEPSALPARERARKHTLGILATAFVMGAAPVAEGARMGERPHEQTTQQEHAQQTPQQLFVKLHSDTLAKYPLGTKAPNGVVEFVRTTTNPSLVLRALQFMDGEKASATRVGDTFKVDDYGRLVFESRGKQKILLKSTLTAPFYEVVNVHAPVYNVVTQTVTHSVDGSGGTKEFMDHPVSTQWPHEPNRDPLVRDTYSLEKKLHGLPKNFFDTDQYKGMLAESNRLNALPTTMPSLRPEPVFTKPSESKPDPLPASKVAVPTPKVEAPEVRSEAKPLQGMERDVMSNKHGVRIEIARPHIYQTEKGDLVVFGGEKKEAFDVAQTYVLQNPGASVRFFSMEQLSGQSVPDIIVTEITRSPEGGALITDNLSNKALMNIAVPRLDDYAKLLK